MERADASTNGGRFKRICVFCGSSSGNKTAFSDAALDLGKELVKRGIDLVYGGGSVGLMGMVSQTVYNGGCNVLGVIPTALMPREVASTAQVNMQPYRSVVDIIALGAEKLASK